MEIPLTHTHTSRGNFKI